MPRRQLRIGHKIALRVDNRTGGYLTSTNNQLRPLGATSSVSDTTSTFENSVFLLVSGDGGVDTDLLRRNLGSPVLFGATVRLLHVTSNTFVCENRRQRAALEKANHKLTLERFNAPDVELNSRWRVLPRWRVRSEGSRVVENDIIVLRSLAGDSYLHIAAALPVSQSGIPSEHFYEANSSSAPTGFEVRAYDTHGAAADPTAESQHLSCGDCLLFVHREERAMVCCVGSSDVVLTPLRMHSAVGSSGLVGGSSSAAAIELFDVSSGSGAGGGQQQQHNFPSASLFVIENQDIFSGGPVLFGRSGQYRLKSLLTNLYLTCCKRKPTSPTGDDAPSLAAASGLPPRSSKPQQQQQSSSRATTANGGAAGGGRKRRPSVYRRSDSAAPGLGDLGATSSMADFGEANDDDITNLLNRDDIVQDYFFALQGDANDPGTLVSLHQAGDDSSPIARSHSRVFIEFPLVMEAAGLWFCSGLTITSVPREKLEQKQQQGGNNNSNSTAAASVEIDVRLYNGAKELLCAKVVPQKDGVEILKVPPEIYQELNFVVSLMPPFDRLLQELKKFDPDRPSSSGPPLTLVEQVRENLTLLIYHCTRSREQNALLREGTPDFTAQCRIAEQNIAPLLLDIVQLSLEGPLDMDKFQSPTRTMQQQQPGGVGGLVHNSLDGGGFPAGLLAALGVQNSASINPSSSASFMMMNPAGVAAVAAAASSGDGAGGMGTPANTENLQQQQDFTKTTQQFMNTTAVYDIINLQNGLTVVVKLIMRLLRQVALENERTSEALAPLVPRLLEWCHLSRLGTKETISQILRDHASLIDTPDDLSLVFRVTEFVKKEGRSSGGSTKLLAVMCTCNGRGLRAAQNVVGEQLLQPAVEELVYKNTGGPNQDWVVCPFYRLWFKQQTDEEVKAALQRMKQNEKRSRRNSSNVGLPGGVSFNSPMQVNGDTNNISNSNDKNGNGVAAATSSAPEIVVNPASPSASNFNVLSSSSRATVVPSGGDSSSNNVLSNSNTNNNHRNSNDDDDDDDDVVGPGSGSGGDDDSGGAAVSATEMGQNGPDPMPRGRKTSPVQFAESLQPASLAKDNNNSSNAAAAALTNSMGGTTATNATATVGSAAGLAAPTGATPHHHQHHRHHHHKNQLCGVFIDMHNVSKIYQQQMFSATNVFEEFRQSETGAGVPIETFCAISSGCGTAGGGGRRRSGAGTSDTGSAWSEGILSSEAPFSGQSNYSGGDPIIRTENQQARKPDSLSHIQGLSRQFMLFAAACSDKHEKNIKLVRQLAPLDVLLAIVAFERLPAMLRAQAFNLITAAHIAIPGRNNKMEEVKSVVHVMDSEKNANLLAKQQQQQSGSSSAFDGGSLAFDGSASFANVAALQQNQQLAAQQQQQQQQHSRQSGSSARTNNASPARLHLRTDTESSFFATTTSGAAVIAASGGQHREQLANLGGTSRDHHGGAGAASLSATLRVALNTSEHVDSRHHDLQHHQLPPLAGAAASPSSRGASPASRVASPASVKNNTNNNKQPAAAAGDQLEDDAETIARHTAQIRDDFVPLLERYLSRKKAMVIQDKNENECINSAIKCLCALLQFDWIERKDFVRWLKILIPVLDGRDDLTPAIPRWNRYAFDEQNVIVMSVKLQCIEAANVMATIVRADLVDRLVAAFEKGEMLLPYVSDVLDLHDKSQIHNVSLQLLLQREKRDAEDRERRDRSGGFIAGRLREIKELTSDVLGVGMDVLEAVGVDRVVRKIGSLIGNAAGDAAKLDLAYLGELVEVLLDNMLYEFPPVVTAATDLLLDLTNTPFALEQMLRRVQILPSAEAVNFYESVKPLQVQLADFESATISVSDVKTIRETIEQLTDLLNSDASRLAENHKILSNMQLHVVVARIIENAPIQQQQQQQASAGPSSSLSNNNNASGFNSVPTSPQKHQQQHSSPASLHGSTRAVLPGTGGGGHMRVLSGNSPASVQASSHHHHHRDQQQQQQQDTASTQMLKTAYRFLLALLNVTQANCAYEVQSDLIPFIATFTNQLPLATEIICTVLSRLFVGRIDICTSVHETAIQDIASMLTTCKEMPLVAHILRLLVFQEDQQTFDVIQGNAESVLRALLETEGLGFLLRCRDFFTGKHATRQIRELVNDVDRFTGDGSGEVVGELMVRFELLQTIAHCLATSGVDENLKAEARIALFGDSVLLDDLPYALDHPAFVSSLFLTIFRVMYLEDSNVLPFIENPNFLRMLRRIDDRLKKMLTRIASMLADEDDADADGGGDGADGGGGAADIVVMLSETNNREMHDGMTIYNSKTRRNPRAALFSTEVEWSWLVHGVVPFMERALRVLFGTDSSAGGVVQVKITPEVINRVNSISQMLYQLFDVALRENVNFEIAKAASDAHFAELHAKWRKEMEEKGVAVDENGEVVDDQRSGSSSSSANNGGAGDGSGEVGKKDGDVQQQNNQQELQQYDHNTFNRTTGVGGATGVRIPASPLSPGAHQRPQVNITVSSSSSSSSASGSGDDLLNSRSTGAVSDAVAQAAAAVAEADQHHRQGLHAAHHHQQQHQQQQHFSPEQGSINVGDASASVNPLSRSAATLNRTTDHSAASILQLEPGNNPSSPASRVNSFAQRRPPSFASPKLARAASQSMRASRSQRQQQQQSSASSGNQQQHPRPSPKLQPLPPLLRDTTAFFFMDERSYQPESLVTVRRLPQQCIRALLAVCATAYEQGRLDFLRPGDFRRFADVIARLAPSRHRHHHRHHHHRSQDEDSGDNNNNNKTDESNIHVFAAWKRAVDVWTATTDGCCDATAFLTTARVILRNGLLGHNSIKNMVRIVDIAASDGDSYNALTPRSRARLFTVLRQVLCCREEELCDAVLVVPEQKPTPDGRPWDVTKTLLSTALSTSERQDIFAEWPSPEYALGPKIVRLLSAPRDVVLEALRCGNALLLGGNLNVQNTIYRFFVSSSREDFFVYCRRFLNACALQCRDRKRTLKRWLDELGGGSSVSNSTNNNNSGGGGRKKPSGKAFAAFDGFDNSNNNQQSNAAGQQQQQQSEEEEDNNNSKKNSRNDAASSLAALPASVETAIASLRLIEGLYNFTLPRVLLRHVQLLVEGHNFRMQEQLREQRDNQLSVNLVETICGLLDELCESVDQSTLDLTLQTLATLSELVQGPCPATQKFIISQNIGSMISRIFSRTHPLLVREQVITLHKACITLLLSLLEGHLDLHLFSTLLQSLDMSALVVAMDSTYIQWRRARRRLFDTEPDVDEELEEAGAARAAGSHHHHHGNNNSNNNTRIAHMSRLAGKGLSAGLNLGRDLLQGLLLGSDDADVGSGGGGDNDNNSADETSTNGISSNTNNGELTDDLKLSCDIFIFMKLMLDVSQLYPPSSDAVSMIVDKNGTSIRDLFESSFSYKRLASEYVAGIEILSKAGNVERVYFRVPSTCRMNLQEETKQRLLREVDRSGDGGRLTDFQERIVNLIVEMDFYSEMRRTRLLSIVYKYGTALDTISILLAFAINFVLLAYVSFEHALTDEYANVPAGQPADVLFGLGVALCVLQCCLALSFFFGQLRIRMNEEWQRWRERQSREAIRISKENLSIEPPAIVNDPKSRLRRYEVWAYNVWFAAQWMPLYHTTFFVAIAFLGLFHHAGWYAAMLLQVAWRSPALFDVLLALAKNRVALLLTLGFLAVILLNFAAISYYNFSEIFGEDSYGASMNCDTLLRCWIGAIAGRSLVMGGGIAEIATPPIYRQSNPWLFYGTVIFGIVFFIIVVLLVLPAALALVLEAFQALREARESIEEDMTSKCFICGISRSYHDRAAGFDEHVKREHNLWIYVYFCKYLSMVKPDEHSGAEAWVWSCMQERSAAWFPIGRSLVGEFRERFGTGVGGGFVSGGGYEGGSEQQQQRDQQQRESHPYQAQHQHHQESQLPAQQPFGSPVRGGGGFEGHQQQPFEVANTMSTSSFLPPMGQPTATSSISGMFNSTSAVGPGGNNNNSSSVNNVVGTVMQLSQRVNEMDRRMQRMEEMLGKLSQKLLS